MRFRAICAAMATAAWAWAGAGAAAQAPAAAEPPAGSPAATQGTPQSTQAYYVEFRVAQIGVYGHSYAAYGPLNANGQPAGAHYADLHPTGNYLLMAVGHVVPVPANTAWNPDVLKLPIASSYRRRLNAAQYGRLLAAVRRARANHQPTWNALTNNCNHFIAELARAVGLRAPSDLKVSYAFVPALREMNETAPARGTPAKRAPAARAPSAPPS